MPLGIARRSFGRTGRVAAPSARELERRPWPDVAPLMNHVTLGGVLLEDAQPYVNPEDRGLILSLNCWFGPDRSDARPVRVRVPEDAQAPGATDLTVGTWVLVGGELVGESVVAFLVFTETEGRTGG